MVRWSRTVLIVAGFALAAAGSFSVQADFQPAAPAARGADAPRLQAAHTQTQSPAAGAPVGQTPRATLDRYCVTCHNQRVQTAGLALDTLDVAHVGGDAAAVWEKVVLKLRGRAMPPTGRPRPDDATYQSMVTWFETELDRAAAADPNPGRPTVHRLNRIEYGHAVRDLLALEVDTETLLPPDDEDQGFDNIADALSVSPTLMERYTYAARRVSQLAMGDPAIPARIETYTVPETEIQDDETSDDLPFGMRGGLAVRHNFPLDGEYVIRVKLRRNFYAYVRGIGNTSHQLDLRLDGLKLKTFSVGGEHTGKKCVATNCGSSGMGDAAWDWYATHADDHLELRVPVKAGLRQVGVAFLRKPHSDDGVLQPAANMSTFGYSTDEGMDANPAVGSLIIGGPYNGAEPAETPSRQRIFVCEPTGRGDEAACAKRIIGTLAKRAYRRPVTPGDLDVLFTFYEVGRREGTFESGIQKVLELLLVDPEFLFRIERDPAAGAAKAYRITDLELASRLSFFVWSSIPDDELLDLAAKGRLKDPTVIEAQVRRMLKDPRSDALLKNFFGQWLELRKLRNVAPDPTIFPEFDQNLREAMAQETELFLADQMRADRSVVDLLRSKQTFVNERLAQHYGIPNIFGNHFRLVTLPDDRRGGILGQGSILTLTSYSNRTSPVLRGKWVLETLLGMPPPAPPPDVPALAENGEGGAPPRSVRERMEIHRKNPTCAVCHTVMDPLGFSLENFDGIGRWRTNDDPAVPGQASPAIDASGVLPDGRKFEGASGLRALLLSQQRDFVGTVTQKLLMYGLGRRIEHYDMPVIRKILKDAAASDYRWSSIVVGIVNSMPFQMRRAS